MTGGGIPGVLRDFADLVRDGEYWESHEVLEGPWRRIGSDFLQGLILYASAFVHLKRGNAHGVQAQLEKALDALEGYPEAYLGVDVAGIREHARASREIASGASAPPKGWASRVRRPRIELRAERIRGDEPELEAL